MSRFLLFGWRLLCTLYPEIAIRIQYKHIMGRNIKLNPPKDLNEKINYLKIHTDLDEWARLSDKYAVRDYVKKKGLENILVPLYGKYDTSSELISDWYNLPDSFVIKSNHGCGTVLIIKDKSKIDINKILYETGRWLKTKYGIETNEPHYRLIKPCLVVEKLLEDDSTSAISKSIIDYKVWCFNGKPYCILVVSNRDKDAQTYQLNTYDLKWNHIDGALTNVHTKGPLMPIPKNFDLLLKYASILSEGHKQVRVDLYDIDGTIYFGELTFTSQGGYMNYFSKDFLLEMGKQFEVK